MNESSIVLTPLVSKGFLDGFLAQFGQKPYNTQKLLEVPLGFLLVHSFWIL